MILRLHMDMATDTEEITSMIEFLMKAQLLLKQLLVIF
jgi:hypothetical protein